MPPPNDVLCFPPGVMLTLNPNGQFVPSQPLVDLLLQARSNYDWPAGTGAHLSQRTIINLVAVVKADLLHLTNVSAHAIAVAVSNWAGNNANAHTRIVAATPAQQNQMQAAIACLLLPGQECAGINELCTLPGISLVIASKIFRFCSPNDGAAVDRHASYFFNSLQVTGVGNATHFVREWANGRHATSRLAIYNRANYARNTAEYFETYLPVLRSITQALNAIPAPYTCAASMGQMHWTPADVEMAAYYWWARRGAR